MDGMLSQEEINALLGGGTIKELVANQTDSLANEEKDAIGEVSNISMGTAATTLSSLVNKRVNITTPVVSYATWEDLAENYDKPCVFIQIYYKEGLDGNNVLIMKENDVKIITDLMMGGDGSNIDGELSELHLSAIGEAMNQMMGSASTSLSSMLEKKVDISPPIANLVDINGDINKSEIASFLEGKFVKVSFKMEIGDLVDSELMQLYPFDLARDIYKKFTGEDVASMLTPEPPIQQAPVQTHSVNPVPVMTAPSVPESMPGYGMPYGEMVQPAPNVKVQPAQFQPFTANSNVGSSHENMNLIMDVPLEVTVELGRTNKSIKEILEFSPGTIIELNKLAGEPIDVLVNGKHVAKGEVVVIEESFGIRVTEIIK